MMMNYFFNISIVSISDAVFENVLPVDKKIARLAFQDPKQIGIVITSTFFVTLHFLGEELCFLQLNDTIYFFLLLRQTASPSTSL